MTMHPGGTSSPGVYQRDDGTVGHVVQDIRQRMPKDATSIIGTLADMNVILARLAYKYFPADADPDDREALRVLAEMDSPTSRKGKSDLEIAADIATVSEKLAVAYGGTS